MSFFSSEYNSLHAENDQLNRVKSALSLKMDSVDFETQTGTIKSYDVSLSKCTCMDFRRRHKPCKHMYCLAIELGIFNANTTSPKATSDSIVDTREIDNKNSIHSSCIFSCSESIPQSFVVIDFETANICPDSICQMGIVVVENNLIIDRKSFLIRPPYEEFTFTNVHGITFDDVKDKPTFDSLWHQIKSYIEYHTLSAYNLQFDINCLLSVLSRYEIPFPTFTAFDVLSNVRSCRYFDCELSELKNYQLVTVAKQLELEHSAHDALSDSIVTAQIQLYLSEAIPERNTTFYFYTVSSLIWAIAKNQLSPSDVVRYCEFLLKDTNPINYDEYKDLFKIIEQMAAHYDNAFLYKYCGLFYEKSNRFSRALYLYEQALSLNNKIGLKSKIQKLKRSCKTNK